MAATPSSRPERSPNAGQIRVAPSVDAYGFRVTVSGPFGADDRIATVLRDVAPGAGRTRVAYDVVAERFMRPIAWAVRPRNR